MKVTTRAEADEEHCLEAQEREQDNWRRGWPLLFIAGKAWTLMRRRAIRPQISAWSKLDVSTVQESIRIQDTRTQGR
jgi:hypothetical protein